jgi:hypothetical protein
MMVFSIKMGLCCGSCKLRRNTISDALRSRSTLFQGLSPSFSYSWSLFESQGLGTLSSPMLSWWTECENGGSLWDDLREDLQDGHLLVELEPHRHPPLMVVYLLLWGCSTWHCPGGGPVYAQETVRWWLSPGSIIQHWIFWSFKCPLNLHVYNIWSLLS